jgi:predicted nucleotidyltransferase
MTRKEKFYKVIESNKEYLRELGVISIGIFGSVVREEDSENSDYDILVEFKRGEKSFRAFTSLCDFLEKYLGNNYELITKESLSPYVGPRILKEIENVKITS